MLQNEIRILVDAWMVDFSIGYVVTSSNISMTLRPQTCRRISRKYGCTRLYKFSTSNLSAP